MRIRTRKNLKLEIVQKGEKSSFLFKDDQASHYPFQWHYHPEAELTLIHKGRGMRFIGDSMEPFQEGDLCLLGPNLPHTWYSDPIRGQDARALVVQFQPDFLSRNFFDLPEFRPVRNLLKQARLGWHFTGPTRDNVIGLLKEIGKEPAGSPQRVIKLLTILTTLAESKDGRTLSKSALVYKDQQGRNSKIQAICETIHRKFPDVPAQSEAAHQAGLSPAGFTRFFKKKMGKTYLDYVSELRIGMACRALLETDKKILDIANASGFNNLSNFNRQFLRFKGITPKGFRKSSEALGA